MSFVFDPSAYPPAVAALLTDLPFAPLGPGTPNETVRPILAAFALEGARDRDMAKACHAALWLAYDFLDESHALSQEIATPAGSYWHAIMHRREPDPSNSKYWWRKVASHPVLDHLVERAPALGYKFTDPYAFVDFVERVRDTGTADEDLARRVQKLEWELLFDWCFRRALHG